MYSILRHTKRSVQHDQKPTHISYSSTSRRHGKSLSPYAQITDPYQRRHAVVKLHSEGWSVTNMSGYLQTPRHRVYEVLKRWVKEGHAGLDDKPRTPHYPARKVTIREINEVKKLAEENPEMGAYRVRTALEQEGIVLSQATCGRLLALNRKLYSLAQPKGGAPRERKQMPFKASFRLNSGRLMSDISKITT